MIKWKKEIWPIAKIKPWDKNPRQRNPRQYKELVESIRKFGMPQSLVVNVDGTLCGGHQRFDAGKEAGLTEFPVEVPEKKLSKKLFEELNIRLNKNVAGEWDREILMEFGKENLSEWGFEEWELKIFNDDSPPIDPSLAAPGGFAHPRASNVRMVQLFLNDETHDPFIAKSKELMGKFNVTNVTDAVAKAVDYAFKNIEKL